jgi:hypothetical protein
MRGWSEAEIACTLDRDDEPTCKVVIIYEDAASGMHAKLFYDKLIHELEDSCIFSLQLWSFQVLTIPEFRESVARLVAQADLVILSLHGKAVLPASMREWIESWSRLTCDRAPALIALLDKSEAENDGNALTLAYLKRVAVRAGLDFFGRTSFSLDKN